MQPGEAFCEDQGATREGEGPYCRPEEARVKDQEGREGGEESQKTYLQRCELHSASSQ